MDARGLSVGAAAFLLAGAVLWLPVGAVGQTLAGQAAATGIAGDLNSRAAANGVNNLQRAKRMLGTPGPDRTWEEGGAKALGAPTGQAPQQPAPAPVSDVASIKVLAEAKELKPLTGWIVSASGKIEDKELVNGQWVYRLIPESDSGFSSRDRLIFEVPQGETSLGRKGERVRAYGAFEVERRSPKGVRMMIFSMGQIVTGQALAEAEAEASANAGAVGAFADPLSGWRLTGTASGLGEGTAVFVGPDDKPRFISPGDKFGPGFKLVGVRSGEAILEQGDKELTVIAW